MQEVELIKRYQKTPGSNKTACLFKTTYPWNNRTVFWGGLISGGPETAKFVGIETVKWYCNNGPIAGWVFENNWTVDQNEVNINLVSIYDAGKFATTKETNS